jgi:hypothetical protein
MAVLLRYFNNQTSSILTAMEITGEEPKLLCILFHLVLFDIIASYFLKSAVISTTYQHCERVLLYQLHNR